MSAGYHVEPLQKLHMGVSDLMDNPPVNSFQLVRNSHHVIPQRDGFWLIDIHAHNMHIQHDVNDVMFDVGAYSSE